MISTVPDDEAAVYLHLTIVHARRPLRFVSNSQINKSEVSNGNNSGQNALHFGLN
jgi:hypothetical protein